VPSTSKKACPTKSSRPYVALINDFIEKFPQSQEGYLYRAQLAANGNNFALADQDMNLALKLNDKPDEAHYSFSRMIYQKEVYLPQIAFEPWSLDKALTEAQEAYSLSPLPAYRYQQAVVLFAMNRYDEAYSVYAELFGSPLRSADLFYEAARCKQMVNDTTAQLALLDSCVAQFSKPYLKEAAPYLLACAQAKREVGKSRDAVSLLNDYEQLMAAQVNDQFYYLRFEAEVAGRLFQQALNDITKAIEMNPASDLYYAEKASLQVRVGLYDEAIETATEALRVAPDHSDGYLFLGLAQCLKGQKAEGIKNLQKAKELGDPQADGLIEKYSK
jgi:tetratricopeptide (TPR) repeat protein